MLPPSFEKAARKAQASLSAIEAYLEKERSLSAKEILGPLLAVGTKMKNLINERERTGKLEEVKKELANTLAKCTAELERVTTQVKQRVHPLEAAQANLAQGQAAVRRMEEEGAELSAVGASLRGDLLELKTEAARLAAKLAEELSNAAAREAVLTAARDAAETRAKRLAEELKKSREELKKSQEALAAAQAEMEAARKKNKEAEWNKRVQPSRVATKSTITRTVTEEKEEGGTGRSQPKTSRPPRAPQPTVAAAAAGGKGSASGSGGSKQGRKGAMSARSMRPPPPPAIKANKAAAPSPPPRVAAAETTARDSTAPAAAAAGARNAHRPQANKRSRNDESADRMKKKRKTTAE